MVCRNSISNIVALIITSLDEQRLMSCKRKTCCKGTSSSTTTDDDIFVTFSIVSDS
jgi:hypothetical protein